MRILVTGGAGFIRWNNKTNSTGQVGSNLVDHFLASGHEVVCLDNLSTGYEKNIEHNFNNPKFKFIEGDIRSYHIVREAVEGVDFILHQAALPSVPRSVKDPLTTNEVNVVGTLNILNAAKDARVKRIVYPVK